jgi:hypothetical protein
MGCVAGGELGVVVSAKTRRVRPKGSKSIAVQGTLSPAVLIGQYPYPVGRPPPLGSCELAPSASPDPVLVRSKKAQPTENMGSVNLSQGMHSSALAQGC